jgi:hypothetical protein
MLSRQLASACKQGSLWRRKGWIVPRWSFRTVSSLPNSKFFRALQQHDPLSSAVVHGKSGRSFDYGNLVGDVVRSKELLLDRQPVLSGQRIAFLAENSYDYVGNVYPTIISKI